METSNDLRYATHLVNAIDQILQVDDEEKKNRLTMEYGSMVLSPLKDSGVPLETLEHLDIQFVAKKDRKEPKEIVIDEDTELGKIQKAIRDTLGVEVLRRLDINMSESLVRKYSPPKDLH